MEVNTFELQARLFGSPRFEWQGEEVTPSSRKGVALLALLAAHRSGLQREEMAEFLWGVGKLASVRQALYELRKLPGASSWLVEEGTAVRLEVRSDLAAFESAIDAADHEGAVARYEGEFLAGLQDVAAPAFVDWLAFERERLSMLYLKALRSDAKRLESEGQFGAARLRVQQALKAEPLDEALYRTGMRLAYVQGDVEGAKELLRRCAAMTRSEFDSEPSEETLKLAAAIDRGQPLPVSSDLSTLPLPHLRLLQAVALGRGALQVEEIAAVLERPSFDVAADLGTLESQELVNAHLAVAPRFLAQVVTSTPVALRRLLHERIAEVLIQGGRADEGEIAQHLLAAGNPAAAVPRLMKATEEALNRSETKEAKALLFRVLWADDGTEIGSSRFEACRLLEGVASQIGDEGLQEAALQEAERLAWLNQSDVQLAEVRMRRARQRLRQGQRGEALELSLEALDIAVRLKDRLLEGRARNAVGGAQFYSGDLDGASESFRRNLDIEDPIERFRANNNLGSLSALRGDLEGAYGYFETALTLARASATRVEVASTLNNLAATAERLSNYDVAVKHFREGLDLARRDRASAIEGQMLVNLAVIYKRQGLLGPAWNTAQEVADLAEALDDLRLEAHSLELRSEVLRACGLFEEAVELQERAVERTKELGDDRRALALEAQLIVLRHLKVRCDFAAAEAAIRRLEEARLGDVPTWLWAEMALAGQEPAEVRLCLQSLGSTVAHRHIQLISDLARVRLQLLTAGGEDREGDGGQADVVQLVRRLAGRAAPGANGSLESGAGAAGRLAPDEVDLVTLEVVERPYGWWLLRRWHERFGGTIDEGATAWLQEPEQEQVEGVLEQQAAGLPKRLRQALGELPATWRDRLVTD